MTATLQGRTVAVTGASRGIGLRVAEVLAAQGAQVVAGARDLSGVPDIAGVQFMTLDVTDQSSVRAFAGAAIAAGADALVNNAGVGSFMPVEDITPDEYRRIMDTNVLGVILTSGAFVPHFRTLESSTIVNVTSDVSARTFARGGLYTASKYAARAITQALAYEGHEYGLRVSEIRSGNVDTYFGDTQQGTPEKQEWLKPDDIAQAVLYALSAPKHVRIDEILLHPTWQPVAF
ncbi:MAG: SDR family NAD(P)-dependent oxidoreductase [Deinococcus sp.]|nr:SDR family NAD(P)-dependent oxidoreductase [Deinococcus sp.]